MQYVADEFHLSATCYLVKIDTSISEACDTEEDDDEIIMPKFRLRWFAPAAEVHLKEFYENTETLLSFERKENQSFILENGFLIIDV